MDINRRRRSRYGSAPHNNTLSPVLGRPITPARLPRRVSRALYIDTDVCWAMRAREQELKNQRERDALEEKLNCSTRQLQTTNQRLQEHNQLLEAYRQIGQMLLSSLDLDQILDMLGQQIVKFGIFRSLMIALVDHRTQQIKIVRGFKETDTAPEGFVRLDPPRPIVSYSLDDDNITAQVAREEQTCIIDGWDQRLDQRFDPDISSTKVSFFIPVVFGGRVLAVLGTGCTPHEKEAVLQRIDAMQPLLDTAAISLDHAHLYRDLKASEERWRQVQKLEAVGQLAASISHNFNNILQSVIGNINLARLDSSGPVAQCLADANDSARRAAEIVRQLLAYSRNETPRNFQELSIKPLLIEAIEQCRKTLPNHIGLNTEIADKLPPISGDTTQLKHALFSLCINAQDAIEEAAPPTPQINIRAYAATLPADIDNNPPQQFIRIEVRDNGIGMDVQTQQRIFEPFFTTKSVDSGTDLGLSTAYGIVKQHGGWLDLSSEVDKGSTFTLHLPVSISTAHCPPAQQALLCSERTD
jgi:signal transduction histidine kinase